MARKKFCLIGEITDFDYHGFWGDFCSPRSLKAFLDGLGEGDEAEIEINSPGGLVILGVEMANAIKNCKNKIVAHVTGIAASMASVIACACDEIVMEEASFMMIHDPWGYMEGNAEGFRKEADKLDQMKSIIMAFYRGKFDRTEEEIAALMSDETWYTGNECAENGLKCTVVKSDVRAAASIVGHKFAKMPEGAAKFMTAKDITAEGKAEIAKAKAEAEVARKAEADEAEAKAKADKAAEEKARLNAEAAAAQAKAEAAAEAAAKSSTGNKSALLMDYLADPDKDRSAEDFKAILKELDAEGFAARYRGASKKINELQAEIEAAHAECDALKKTDGENVQKIVALEGAINDFKDQVEKAGFNDLDALIGAVSGLKADLEKGATDLAACREQLDHLKKTRDLLTGGVLTPSAELPTLQEGLDKCKTPKEKSAFIASGKYRKDK